MMLFPYYVKILLDSYPFTSRKHAPFLCIPFIEAFVPHIIYVPKTIKHSDRNSDSSLVEVLTGETIKYKSRTRDKNNGEAMLVAHSLDEVTLCCFFSRSCEFTQNHTI